MQLKSPIVLILLLQGSTYHALIVPWKTCPVVGILKSPEFNCEIRTQNWQLIPLAHIPGGSGSLSLYHNPYPPLNCLIVDFYCRKDAFIVGDLVMAPRQNYHMVCPGYNILVRNDGWKVHISTNPDSKECETVDKWLSMDVFVFEQNNFIFMYDCRQLGANLPVAIGGWVLVNANASSVDRQEVLRKIRSLTMLIPGFRDEWWVYLDANDKCITNTTCDYLANCKILPDANEMIVSQPDAVENEYWIVGLLVSVMIVLIILSQMIYKHFLQQLCCKSA